MAEWVRFPRRVSFKMGTVLATCPDCGDPFVIPSTWGMSRGLAVRHVQYARAAFTDHAAERPILHRSLDLNIPPRQPYRTA